ncbi:MAG: hypothetical protein PHV57_00090 [Methanomicrobiaceae archaeon]|nr:hypothetical protein [Methanomicrobiaceae archaeon]
MSLFSVEAPGEDGITNLMTYLIFTGVLLLFLIVTMFTVNAVFMEGPANTLCYHAFVDIGNGISTRIVDIYVVSPDNGTIVSKFDIPDDVVGREYLVALDTSQGVDQVVEVSGGSVRTAIHIAGIAETKGVTGRTTGTGLNVITYDSEGV